jgi:ankyrin repeat protein
MARKKAQRRQENRKPDLRVLLQRAETGESAAAVKAYIDAGGSFLSSTYIGVAPNMQQQMPILHSMAYRNAHPHTELAESVRLMVAAGADINITAGPEHDARTALMLASEKGCCTEVVQAFLQNGASVLATNTKGITALHLAAAAGHNDSCEVLLAKESSAVHVKDVHNYTALRYAADFGSVATVKMLHEHGADINTVDNDGTTPLIAASESKRVDMTVYLLKAGADVNVVNSKGHTALAVAVTNNSIPIVQLLLNHGADISIGDNAGQNALFKAAGKGHVFIMVMLVKRGASITAVDNEGNTILMIALHAGHKSAAEWLIQHGVAVTAANIGDFTALHTASALCNKDTSIVELLLANGVDVNKRNIYGYTALDVAAVSSEIQCIKVLIAAGADILLADNCGLTSMHRAIMEHNDTVVHCLLGHGATAVMNSVLPVSCSEYILDCENCSCTSLTALMLCPTVDTVKVLLTAGADVHISNDAGDTCLHLAVRHKRAVPIVCLLIKAGADLHAVNNDGKTAAQIAHDIDNTLIEQILNRAAQQQQN